MKKYQKKLDKYALKAHNNKCKDEVINETKIPYKKSLSETVGVLKGMEGITTYTPTEGILRRFQDKKKSKNY